MRFEFKEGSERIPGARLVVHVAVHSATQRDTRQQEGQHKGSGD